MATLGLALLGLGVWRLYDANCLLSGFTGLYAIGFGGITLGLGLWLGWADAPGDSDGHRP